MNAGLQPRAPDWMQQSGLEWLYRLLNEPRRLWRRYLLLNPLFCWNLLTQLVHPARYEDDMGMPPATRMNVG
jgi:UDP-N-acetyl-D-mannosaminuronic acid transferase (WecB/TagA/CpsF family)